MFILTSASSHGRYAVQEAALPEMRRPRFRHFRHYYVLLTSVCRSIMGIYTGPVAVHHAGHHCSCKFQYQGLRNMTDPSQETATTSTVVVNYIAALRHARAIRSVTYAWARVVCERLLVWLEDKP